MAVLWSFGYILALIIIASPCEASISCTFDSGNCGWHVTNVSASGFRWTNTSGQTNDRTSGPLNDHTCNNYNGKYMYIMGSKSDPNETAFLDSEEAHLTESTQLTFWYSMHGLGIGNLSLLEITGNGTVTHELWSQWGRHGKDWKLANVTVTPGTKYFRFVGTTRLPFSSDIAIDDVKLSSESPVDNLSYCAATSTTLSTTSTSTTSTTSASHKPTPSATTPSATTPDLSTTSVPPENVSYISLPWSCDFENGFCGLRIVPDKHNKQVTWQNGSHIQIYDKVNIEQGHVTSQHEGTHYLTFNSARGWLTVIEGSSEVTTGYMNESVLLSFWYNMPHKNSNLQVVVRTLEGHEDLVWNRTASTDGARFGWFQENLTISACTPFKVLFVTSNIQYPTRVGIDDISIFPDTSTNSSATVSSSCTPSTSSLSPSSPSSPSPSTPSPSTQSSTTLSSTLHSVPSKVSLLSTISGSKLTDKKPITSTVATVTKKATEKPEKKPEDELANNEQEVQTRSKYTMSSSVVGGLVAGLVGVVIVGLVIYFVRARYRSNNPLRNLRNVTLQSNIKDSYVVQGTSFVKNEPRATKASGVSVGHGKKRFSSEIVHGRGHSNAPRIYKNGSAGHVNDAATNIDVDP